jgi:hypothetical protein
MLTAILSPFAMADSAQYVGPSNPAIAWRNPSVVNGTVTNLTFDGFEVPANSTILDGWLQVSTDGYVPAGNGTHWRGDDAVSNFSTGVFNGSSSDIFNGDLSLAVNHTVGRIDDLEFLTKRFQQFTPSGPNGNAANIWRISEPGLMSTPLTWNTTGRLMAGGIAPSLATEGTLIAATLPEDPVPAGTHAWLTSEQYPLPGVVNDWRLEFDHWVHLPATNISTGSGGAWLEASIDGGLNWRWLEPVGGYDWNTSVYAPVPLDAPATSTINSSTGMTGSFPAFGGHGASGWQRAVYDLSQLNTSGGTSLQIRFVIWTDPTSALNRPGWHIDNIEISNDGAAPGSWFHGNLYGEYAADAYGALTVPVQLDPAPGNNTVGAWMLRYWVDFDMEGGYWDNYEIHISNDNISWYQVSPVGKIPGLYGITINGVTYTQESAGWREVAHSFPTNFQPNANGSLLLRFAVETDGMPGTGFGGSINPPEGVFIDDLSITLTILGNTQTMWSENFSNSANATHQRIFGGTSDQWQYLANIGNHGPWNEQWSFEGAPLLADGWNVHTYYGAGWSFGQVNNSAGYGPSQWTSGSTGVGIVLNNRHAPNTWSHLISPALAIPEGASARLSFNHFICLEPGWDAGVLFYSTDNGTTWQQFGVNIPGFYETLQVNNSLSPLYGMWAWDGSTKKSGCLTNKSMQNVEADVSHLSGQNIMLRFSFFSDDFIEGDGWYIDDVGIVVDWFESNGSWLSPEILPGPLGYDHICYSVNSNLSPFDLSGNILDSSTGQILATWPSDDLVNIDAILHPSLRLQLEMSTSDASQSPRFDHIGHGPCLDYSFEGNSSNPTLNSVLLKQMTFSSSHIFNELDVQTHSSGLWISITDSVDGTMLWQGTVSGGMVSLASPTTSVEVEIHLQAGGWASALSLQAQRLIPLPDASIDVGADGDAEWAWSSSDGKGLAGYQNSFILPNGLTTSTIPKQFAGGDSINLTIRLPIDSIHQATRIGFTYSSPSNNLSLKFTHPISGQFVYHNISTNDTMLSGSVMLSYDLWHGNLPTSGVADSAFPSREWGDVTIEVTSVEELSAQFHLICIRYELTETVNGLGEELRQSMNATIADVGEGTILYGIAYLPVQFSAEYGRVSIDGGLIHAKRIENSVYATPTGTMVPLHNYTIVTDHMHLLGPSEIDVVDLRLQTSNGNHIEMQVESINGAPVFIQRSGEDKLTLLLEHSEVLMQNDGTIRVRWVLQPQWAFDDESTIQILAEAVESNGFTLGPAHAQIGASNVQAMENDLEARDWTVRDSTGRLLSNTWDARYPFYAKSGSILIVTGGIRFEGQQNVHPDEDSYLVAVQILTEQGESAAYGEQVGVGLWRAVVDLPSEGNVTLRPVIVQLGPLGVSALGVEDATSNQLSTVVKIDSVPPTAGPLMIHTPEGGQMADGNVVNPQTMLPLWIEVQDAELLGTIVTLHHWIRSYNDADGDGIADPSEYGGRTEVLGGTPQGTLRVDFLGLPSGIEGDEISAYVTGADFAGHAFVAGGGPGQDNDLATIQVETQQPTQVSLASLDLDREDDIALFTGIKHRFEFTLIDQNGIDSIDEIRLHIAGEAAGPAGTLVWHPISNQLISPEGSQLHPFSVQVEDLGDFAYHVILNFAIGLDAPTEWQVGPNVPDLVIIEGGSRLTLGTENLVHLGWALDHRLMWVVDNAEDLTTPAMGIFDGMLNLQPGDRFSLGASIHHRARAVAIDIPINGAATISIEGGTEIVIDSAVVSDGSFTTVQDMSQDIWPGPTATLVANLAGFESLNISLPSLQFVIAIDSISPYLEFQQTSLVILQSDALANQLVSFNIFDAGGMGDNPLTLRWTYSRWGVDLVNMQGTYEIGLSAYTDGIWVYSDYVDFTPLTPESLQVNDQLLVWVEGADLAGNSLIGSNTRDNPRAPSLRVMYFAPQITDVQIGPEKPEVGDILEIDVRIINGGNLRGEISVGLWAQENRGGMVEIIRIRDVNLTLEAGEAILLALDVEAWREGDLQLYLVMNEDVESWQALSVPRIQERGASSSAIDKLVESTFGVGLLILICTALGFGLAILALNRDRYDDEYEDEELLDDDEGSFDGNEAADEEDWPEPPEEFPDEHIGEVPPPLPPGLSDDEVSDSASEEE